MPKKFNYLCIALVIIVMLLVSNCVEATERTDHSGPIRRAGDITQMVTITTSLAASQRIGDDEGSRQLFYSCLVGQGATELLKRWVASPRPDGSDTKSFPSGHTYAGFCGATFTHVRYGFEEAWPLYIVAAYTGYSRVWANRHRWVDVLGSAVLAYGISELMVDEYNGDMSYEFGDYAWGFGVPTAYNFGKNGFPKKSSPSSQSILFAEGLNYLVGEHLPHAEHRDYEFNTYFVPIDEEGIGIRFELNF